MYIKLKKRKQIWEILATIFNKISGSANIIPSKTEIKIN